MTMSRKFPDFLQAYMQYSQHSEAPDKFHFWTGVSIVAGALRRRTWMDMGYFQWTPNFYIIFVAPPGIISKSTTASIGMNLLKKVDGIKFGPDAVTWQALAQSLANSTEGFPLPGEEELLMPMSAITIVSSEFGNFLNPHDREMVDMLVSLWDGQVGVWKKATKTMGDDVIENPWINVLACTTPAWIAGNFPEYMIGGGFTSRCIFVYGDRKRRFVAYPADHLPSDFQQWGDNLIHDLEHISATLCGGYKLTPEAKAWGEAWYEEHYSKSSQSHLNSDKFAGYLARKQTHIHKLAMVMEASRSDHLQITQEILESANSIISTLELDMPKVFGHIGLTHDAKMNEELVAYVRRAGSIDRADLYRKMFGNMHFKDFLVYLESAQQAGYITQATHGKSTIVYATNVKPEEELANVSEPNGAINQA
jgi:hypothetical protein